MPDGLELSRSDLTLAGRATIEAVALDEGTAARLLRTINRLHARTPLALEDVYLFPGNLSTQAIDYYGTRMSPRSMRNYRADIKGGLALMNMHRTGGFLTEGEQPVGRIFEADLEGDALNPGEAGFDGETGLQLAVWSYMLRGIRTTDVANDDLIRAIEGGTTKDMSISFSVHPDGQFVCSICGQDYYDWGSEDPCRHLAFMSYEGEGGDAQRCFVWVENAHAYEGSLVYKGATPGAMVRKAKALAPDLPRADVGWLEERYQVRLMDDRTISIPRKETTSPSSPPSPQPSPSRERGRERGRESEEVEELEVGMDRSEVLTVLGRLVGDEAAAVLDEVEGDAEFALRVLDLVTNHFEVRVEQALEAAEGLRAQVAEMEPDAELGLAYKSDLVEECIKARVQAQGNGFDAEKYRAVLMGSNDLDFIKGEREAWRERAAEVLRGGRRVRVSEDDPSSKAPMAAYQ